MLYEFKCGDCHKKFEMNESMKETTPTKECPFCSGIANKIIQLAPVIYKGNGWSEGNNPHEKFDRLGGKKKKRKQR